MASATGDEAAAMDSISRAPAAPPAAVSAAVSASVAGNDQTEAPVDGAEAASSAPKKGDSGVETAEEAVEPSEPDINVLCGDMFEKMAIFLQGELTATCDDYRLLENMNKLTSLKYMEMKDISINISRNLQDLNNKYASLQPYLDQINEIEEHVTSLEQAAYKLDAYSKKLEARFKKLEKR
ncbi:unnamed protein product [Knipowitschia caucasica]|uniref:Biogenesis of lysosome-related organelles complex 1 subunit 2 n=1 Tax=Knipowitschia caucasica TaxID=637954 RepID=A0AAV2KZZ7_KNICA